MKFVAGGRNDLSYFLANDRSFFHRFADSGFRTKWTGFWIMEKKLLEYFAVKAGGEWLGPENIKKTEYDYSKAVHHYETGSGKVTETVFVPEEGSDFMVSVECERPVDFEIKLAVNIRLINENETYRNYEVAEKKGGFEFGNGIGKVFFRMAGTDTVFSRKGTYESHEPAGEKQNYFVPGTISARGKKIVFSFGAQGLNPGNFGRMLLEKEKAIDEVTAGIIKSDDEKLSDGFRSAVLAMRLLRKTGGYFAGLPWFQDFWGRDTFWSLPALTDLGYHDEARKILEYFAKNSDYEKIPNFISKTGGKSFNSIDSTLLWIISLEHYIMESGDMEFLSAMQNYLIDFVAFLYGRTSGAYLEHDKECSETWMDTTLRCCKAVDVQALYWKALKSASRLFDLLGKGETSAGLSERAAKIEEIFDDDFYEGGYYADRIDPCGKVAVKTCNPLVAAMLGLGKRHREILNVIESERFLCPKGVRTLSSDEEGYTGSGYHSGASWSLTTAWAAAAEFANGRPERGWEIMQKLIADLGENGMGCVGECWDSETSKLTGCGLQLWGCAFLVRLVDEFMLGIETDAEKNTIRVSPSLPGHIKYIERARLLGRKKVLLRFSRKAGGIHVECSRGDVKLIKVQKQ